MRADLLRAAVTSRFAIVWFACIGLLLVALVLAPNAVAPASLLQALPFAGVLAVTAIGQTLVVQQRGVDFSVPGIVTMAGVVVAFLSTHGVDPLTATLVGVVLGVAGGVFNGVVVVYLALTPLVATLASNGVFIAVALIVSGGFPTDASAAMRDLAQSAPGGVSLSAWVAVVVVLVASLMIRRTVVGRRFVAVGSNAAAARVATIATRRYQVGAYGVAGGLYALAGALLAGYVGSARMDMGTTYLLASITAVVIGGTPLTGGVGSVLASLAGAVFQALLNLLVLGLGAPTTVQLLAQCVVLIAAVAAPGLIARRSGRRPVRVAVAQNEG